MNFAVNGVTLPVYPASVSVTVLDLDDAETTTRTADGRLSRDRIAVKRQIELSWRALKWEDLSSILTEMSEPFFEFTYPDSMTGQHETKTFYVGDRSAPIAIERNGVLWWEGLQLTLTEE
mgnify:CR=1 FL=1|jgi:hypothetical protein